MWRMDCGARQRMLRPAHWDRTQRRGPATPAGEACAGWNDASRPAVCPTWPASLRRRSGRCRRANGGHAHGVQMRLAVFGGVVVAGGESEVLPVAPARAPSGCAGPAQWVGKDMCGTEVWQVLPGSAQTKSWWGDALHPAVHLRAPWACGTDCCLCHSPKRPRRLTRKCEPRGQSSKRHWCHARARQFPVQTARHVPHQTRVNATWGRSHRRPTPSRTRRRVDKAVDATVAKQEGSVHLVWATRCGASRKMTMTV